MTINKRIKELEKTIEILKSQIVALVKNTEEKTPSPHSKLSQQAKLTNMDLIFHNGIWKTYAIYKDDEEEEA